MFFIPKLKIQPKTTDWADVALVTDEKIIKRVDRLLVRPICRAGMWGWFHNLLPLAGGTAQAHATSLTHPGTRDVTWNGTITHNADGVQGDGVTGYGVMPPNTDTMGDYDLSFGVYLMDTWASANDGSIPIGRATSFNGHMIRYKSTGTDHKTYTYGAGASIDSTGVEVKTAANDLRGLVQASGAEVCYRNGSIWGSNNGGAKNTSMPSSFFYLCARFYLGNPISFYNGRIALAFITNTAATLQQHQTLYNIIQKYQVAMGRAYVA